MRWCSSAWRSTAAACSSTSTRQAVVCLVAALLTAECAQQGPHLFCVAVLRAQARRGQPAPPPTRIPCQPPATHLPRHPTSSRTFTCWTPSTAPPTSEQWTQRQKGLPWHHPALARGAAAAAARTQPTRLRRAKQRRAVPLAVPRRSCRRSQRSARLPLPTRWRPSNLTCWWLPTAPPAWCGGWCSGTTRSWLYASPATPVSAGCTALPVAELQQRRRRLTACPLPRLDACVPQPLAGRPLPNTPTVEFKVCDMGPADDFLPAGVSPVGTFQTWSNSKVGGRRKGRGLLRRCPRSHTPAWPACPPWGARRARSPPSLASPAAAAHPHPPSCKPPWLAGRRATDGCAARSSCQEGWVRYCPRAGHPTGGEHVKQMVRRPCPACCLRYSARRLPLDCAALCLPSGAR